MKRLLMLLTIILMMAVLFMPVRANAEIRANPVEVDSDLYPDMLMLMLLPQIQEAVNSYYRKVLTVEPVVYPYEFDVLKAARANQNPNNRDYDFLITLEVQPVVGPAYCSREGSNHSRIVTAPSKQRENKKLFAH
ncbi:DUF3888 domain-containing protein [Paenibacillus alvei]|uniref:DUF3888 domain-containing protein n=1 Tax=Paenibacillus alvei TaxID=44250 RepID=UPI0018CD9EAC|nr:DUF3888 domain-containing protein [Paenibacillus alvei]MCY9578322.1 DUF3888 domain-containing protein [Paenibacillus alvei]MCY9584643.1 DUF3888 domain-containing protein [Paenibacillus alvei]